jgi:hypothetical protein
VTAVNIASTPDYVTTPTRTLSLTPTSQPVFDYTENGRQSNMFSIGAIGIAAIFLGALFTVITRKKPV